MRLWICFPIIPRSSPTSSRAKLFNYEIEQQLLLCKWFLSMSHLDFLLLEQKKTGNLIFFHINTRIHVTHHHVPILFNKVDRFVRKMTSTLFMKDSNSYWPQNTHTVWCRCPTFLLIFTLVFFHDKKCVSCFDFHFPHWLYPLSIQKCKIFTAQSNHLADLSSHQWRKQVGKKCCLIIHWKSASESNTIKTLTDF